MSRASVHAVFRMSPSGRIGARALPREKERGRLGIHLESTAVAARATSLSWPHADMRKPLRLSIALVLSLSSASAFADNTDLLPPSPWKPGQVPVTVSRPATPAWEGNVSTSGTDVAPVKPLPAPATDPGLEARVKQLESQLAALQVKPDGKSDDWTKHLRVGGYIQPQLIWQIFNTAASPNTDANGLPGGIGPNDTIAKSDGTTTNPDFFRLRRARLFAVANPTDFATIMLEIEPLPRGGSILGSDTIARQVYAAGIARFSEMTRLEIGAGEFKVPFGWELLQLDPDRPFIERSFMAGNLFPAEHDVGAFANLYAGRLTLMSAVLNGVMLGERNFAIVPDFNRGKDLVARVNYDGGPTEIGASGYVGSGSLVDAQNLRFKQYGRWAANAELALHHEFSRALGQTKAFGEVTYAQNMDRGVNISYALPQIPSDVSQSVINKHELGFFLRAEQDATRWLTLGVRYDYYTPDTALPDNQRHTFSGVVAFHFTKNLQLMTEYDSAVDRIHPDGAATRTKTINSFSGVLQGRL